jgi:hypothetical protein
MEIYKITNKINGKIYVGKDTTSNINYYGSGILIKRAIKKYGIQNFVKEIIDRTEDYVTLSDKEKYWIESYDSTNPLIGYNISLGGDGGDTLSKHPDIQIIKEKISSSSPKKGKTYEEAFGVEYAKKYKQNLSGKIPHNKDKTYDLLYGKSKSEQIKTIISDNTKKNWTDERKLKQSQIGNKNIENNLNRKDVISNNKKILKIKWDKIRNLTITELTNFKETENIDKLIHFLEKIPNSIFKNRGEYYDFLGENISSKIKTFFDEKRTYINSNNNVKFKKKIKIDNKIYESIKSASDDTKLSRSLIKYRLKSPNFKNYIYL